MSNHQLLKIAKLLASSSKPFEEAVVIYEDGYLLHLRGSSEGVAVPLVGEHGRAVALVHTHPVPRTAPSLSDLEVLVTMSKLKVPEPALATVYSDGKDAVVTVYRARSPLPPAVEEALLRHFLEYERLNVTELFNPQVSEKQVREQHALLSKFGISVERFRVRVAASTERGAA